MSLPTAEQFEVAELMTRALIRNLPQTGILDAADVRQMADEALVALVAEGKAPSDPAQLGGAIRHKLIDRLRKEGALSRKRKVDGEEVYERPEVALTDDESTARRRSGQQHRRPVEQASVLTPTDREVLRLSFEDDLTPAGIAELTGRSEHSIEVSKINALRALRGELLPRALETLAASANGLMARETAAEMGISLETVKSYRKQAIAALGARNTCHAVAIAYRRGLLV